MARADSNQSPLEDHLCDPQKAVPDSFDDWLAQPAQTIEAEASTDQEPDLFWVPPDGPQPSAPGGQPSARNPGH